MKKTYNRPACIVVALCTTQMMAESIGINSTTTINNSNDILVKEDKIGNTNLWDNEW